MFSLSPSEDAHSWVTFIRRQLSRCSRHIPLYVPSPIMLVLMLNVLLVSCREQHCKVWVSIQYWPRALRLRMDSTQGLPMQHTSLQQVNAHFLSSGQDRCHLLPVAKQSTWHLDIGLTSVAFCLQP